MQMLTSFTLEVEDWSLFSFCLMYPYKVCKQASANVKETANIIQTCKQVISEVIGVVPLVPASTVTRIMKQLRMTVALT